MSSSPNLEEAKKKTERRAGCARQGRARGFGERHEPKRVMKDALVAEADDGRGISNQARMCTGGRDSTEA